jgi:uncharacterized protein
VTSTSGPGSESGASFEGRTLAEGHGAGLALVLDEPLSFWGGLDPETGLVIDRRHPQHGLRLTGSVLIMPFGRGSSSSSTVLAEAIRLRTAPSAIVLLEADHIIALAGLVAAQLYGLRCPVVLLDEGDYRSIRTGDKVEVRTDGALASVAFRARDGSF